MGVKLAVGWGGGGLGEEGCEGWELVGIEGIPSPGGPTEDSDPPSGHWIQRCMLTKDPKERKPVPTGHPQKMNVKKNKAPLGGMLCPS